MDLIVYLWTLEALVGIVGGGSLWAKAHGDLRALVAARTDTFKLTYAVGAVRAAALLVAVFGLFFLIGLATLTMWPPTPSVRTLIVRWAIVLAVGLLDASLFLTVATQRKLLRG